MTRLELIAGSAGWLLVLLLMGLVFAAIAVDRARAARAAERRARSAFDVGYQAGYVAMETVYLEYRANAQLALRAVQSAGGAMPSELLGPGEPSVAAERLELAVEALDRSIAAGWGAPSSLTKDHQRTPAQREAIRARLEAYNRRERYARP